MEAEELSNMGQKLISTIQLLYTRASSSVLAQGVIEEWFHTSMGVRQGCLLSPTLFNILLERIKNFSLKITRALSELEGRTSRTSDTRTTSMG